MTLVKKAAALLMAAVMSLAFAIPALADTKPSFQDVPQDAYYYPAVEWAWLRDITKGASTTTFEPESVCTRGQVATFLWRAADKPEPKTTKNPFTDVKSTSPFYKAILWAYENEITSGTSKTTFSPGNACTRAHVLTFLWRSQGKPDAPYSELADYRLPQGYWTAAFRWGDNQGLLSVTDVSPENSCPRSDIVYYLYKTMTREDAENGTNAATGFPVPTGETFGLKGEDAALYNAVAKRLCADVIDGDLLLPSLAVYGSYDAGNGAKSYVCDLLRFYYYGPDIKNADNLPESQVGASGSIARITVKDGVCTEIAETEDGATASGRAERIRELCGPLSDLAKSLNNETAKSRKITPDTYQALLSAYANTQAVRNFAVELEKIRVAGDANQETIQSDGRANMEAIRERSLVNGKYPTNAAGKTYGPIGLIDGVKPDLIAVRATNGKSGYVLSEDRDKCMNSGGTCTVYDLEGNIIGEFAIE